MERILVLLKDNWFNLVQTLSIVLGLVFAGISLRRENTSRNLSNLLTLKEEHRELWKTMNENPELARVLKEDADIDSEPLTHLEQIFLHQIIVHASVSFELIRSGTPLDDVGFRKDIGDFFRRPLPRAAWAQVRDAHRREFVKVLEKAVKAAERKKARKT